MLENVIFFSSSHNYASFFKYFEQHIEIFWKNVYFINFFVCLALIPIRIHNTINYAHAYIYRYPVLLIARIC
jgi:hypothetical protein